MNELRRPQQGRWIAGVCLAIANRFGWSATTVRILAIVGLVFLGLPLWAYVILWILIPTDH